MKKTPDSECFECPVCCSTPIERPVLAAATHTHTERVFQRLCIWGPLPDHHAFRFVYWALSGLSTGGHTSAHFYLLAHGAPFIL
jgi:hypothetical protein